MNTSKDMTAYLEQAFEVNKICNELADENSRFYFMYSGENLAGYLKLNEAPAQTDINDKYSQRLKEYMSQERSKAML